MPYQKMSTYDEDMYLLTLQDQDVRFWLFDPDDILEQVPQLKNELVPTAKRSLTLPKEVLSVLVYDKNELAWVYRDRIEFHGFDQEKSVWEPSRTPVFKFNDKNTHLFAFHPGSQKRK